MDADFRPELLAIVEQASRVGIVVLDADGIVRRWGPALERALGYTQDETLGRPLPGLTDSGRELVAAAISTAMAGYPWHGGILRHPRKDGSVTALRLSAHPLHDSNGRIVAVAIIAVDVTESERYRALHRRLTEVTSAVRGVADLDDILRQVRDAIVELGGFDRAGVFQVEGDAVIGAWGTDSEGRPTSESHLRETLEDWGPNMAQLITGERAFVIEQWQPPDAAQPIEHVVMAMRAGDELVGLISADNLITGRPITEGDVEPLVPFAEEAAVAIRDARLHQQVRHHAEHLEREVASRTAELERAIADLEQFTYRVAHDLRAPLRAIDGMAHIILEEMQEHGAISETDIEVGVRRISASARLAGRLVDDLLALARVGRRPFNPIELDPGEAALAAWKLLEAAGKTRGIRPVVRPMRRVVADRDMLVEVYLRLLDNALKFTIREPAPRIEIGEETEPSTCPPTLYVRDNGVGFDPIYAARVFGEFARVHSPDEFEGSGIGLAIVRRIIERHGGRIWATAAPGQGATFCWQLEPGQPS